MLYIMLIHADQEAGAQLTSEEHAAIMEKHMAFSREMRERNIMRGGDELRPASVATTVRVRGGETLTTDGPYAETKEQLGGYYLLECKDMDEAIECAAKIPTAVHGHIEIRPLLQF